MMCWILAQGVLAQLTRGRVVDGETQHPLVNVLVYYADDRSSMVLTDSLGMFHLPSRRGDLVFSLVGYDTKILQVRCNDDILVLMMPNTRQLQEVEIVAKRNRYSRKNNPAVELMRHVIAAKRSADPQRHPYFSYRKYERITTSLDNLSEHSLDMGVIKHFPFLLQQLQLDSLSNSFTLPLLLQEKVSRYYFRRSPKMLRTYVEGQRQEGISDLMNSGGVLTGMLEDIFQDVNIMDNRVRLFQYPFISPVADGEVALRFYRYFIADTVLLDNKPCVRIDFTPNHVQDFGFSGSLYVFLDSTYNIRKTTLSVPIRSDINFVDRLELTQHFVPFLDSSQVISRTEMKVRLKLTSRLSGIQVWRISDFSEYANSMLPDSLFCSSASVVTQADALHRDDHFWSSQRSEALASGEQDMGDMVSSLLNVKGAKSFLWIAKILVENYVETSTDPTRPSKFDFGPVNTFLGSNFVEGFRIRLGGQTTAHLHRHCFLGGYAKYGFGDKRWKGMGKFTYSFNAKDYLPHEYPVRQFTFSYTNDVMSPSDKFLSTDKDNVFVSWKWASVRHMNYFERYNLAFDWELQSGFCFSAQIRRERNEGAGDLIYQSLSQGELSPKGEWQPCRQSDHNIHALIFSESTFGLRYQPGVTWVHTKNQRHATNMDSPIFELNHTVGIKKLLGGQYDYNYTELDLYKRFWLRTWGKVDLRLKASVQWNKVPFPFLSKPLANLSYIAQENMFRLVNNMEFLNDRMCAVFLSWDMNGKLFNRIPGLSRLRWREYLACNLMWGMLTDKNNPFLYGNQNDEKLFFFPGYFNAEGKYEFISRTMNARIPYVELVAGIHNIFKVFHVECVYRASYHAFDTRLWGVRAAFRMKF